MLLADDPSCGHFIKFVNLPTCINKGLPTLIIHIGIWFYIAHNVHTYMYLSMYICVYVCMKRKVLARGHYK